MTGMKKRFGINVLCSFLILAFLTAVPAISHASPHDLSGGDNPTPEITPDPLHRLPASPAEAHRLLEEREAGWPEGESGSPRAAMVMAEVRVSIPHDTVEGFTNHPLEAVIVELKRGATTIDTVNTVTKDDGWFKADFSASDIRQGDRVWVTDVADGNQFEINCVLTASIDFASNKVSGTAVAGNTIDVYIAAPSTYYGDIPPGAAHRRVTAGGGNFEVSFDLNLRNGDAAFVYSSDANGNKVMNVAAGSGKGLVVYPQYDEVMGYYQPGAALTVQAGSAARETTVLKDGFFEAWFTDHDIVPGEKVSCNMGGERNIIVREVSAVALPSSNHVKGTAPAGRDIRITMDVNGTPAVIESTADADGNFDLDLQGRYTITGSEVFNVTWYDDDGDAVVYQFNSFSWYLAEGYTGGQFDTWVLVQNPGTETATVTMSFQLLSGSAADYVFTLEGGRRQSVHLDDLPGLADAQVSTKVASTQPVVAERAMYFNYEGKSGGHDSIGVPEMF